MKNSFSSIFYIFLFLALAAVVLPRTVMADDILASSGIFVGAEVPSVANISVAVKSIDADLAVSSMTWLDQVTGNGWQKALQYIELSIECNEQNWQVDIYTNNTGADAGLIQRNGLLSTTSNTKRIPLGWVVSDSTVSITELGEPGELIKNNVAKSGGTVAAGWKYVKDKGDIDDAGTSAWDESWTSAQAGLYTAVLYGNASNITIPYGGTAVSPAVIYLEGEFTYADPEMRYQSTIWLDIYFQ